MYIKDYEFRYSDIDKDGNIKVSTVLDLLQDISIAHTAKVGLNTDKMRSMSVACLLEGWRIRFDEPLTADKKVTVETGITQIHRCESIRRYEIRQGGRCKVTATAVWFTVDIAQMKIIRIPQIFFEVYESTSEPDNGLKYIKLRPQKDSVLFGEAKVESRDLDTNNHMNNAKSVEVAMNFLPQDFDISELRIKYCKELKKNENIRIFSNQADTQFHCEIRNENDEPCVIICADRK